MRLGELMFLPTHRSERGELCLNALLIRRDV